MKQMNFHKELAKLTPRLRDNRPGKIYVFGIGEQWKGIHQWYIDVVNVDLTEYIFAFVDNDPAKQGAEYMGRQVIAPAEMDIENAVVLISSHKYSYDLTQQLQKIGLVYHSSFYTPIFFSYILKRFVYAETAKYSNSVQGGRCFIVGNGPSLLAEDLEILHKKNQATFAVNNIVNIFDKTIWRPTYYFVHDTLIFPEMSILNQMKYPKFMGIHNACKNFFDEYTYYYEIDGSPLNYDFPYRPKFSNNIELMYIGGSIIYPTIQAAVSMGYNEIYLLGIDHKIDTEVLHDGTIINSDVERHFYKDKQLIMAAAIDILNASFKCAREYCDSHSIKIRNATRGGALEIFERVDFDDLFKSSTREDV